MRIAIISSNYRPDITKHLVFHCITTLKKNGLRAQDICIYDVPGSLEIPLVAKQLAQKRRFSAIICFGAVFKGKTYHFEQVSNECIRGCMDVSRAYDIPVIFEVLCVYDPKDAMERATGTLDNRGVEGAKTALAMIRLLSSL